MGPQLYRCGNAYMYPADRQSRCVLQWGRNFIVAEMARLNPVMSYDNDASMGPQLYRCGNFFQAALVLHCGYASMGPQLYRCGNGAKCQKQYR